MILIALGSNLPFGGRAPADNVAAAIRALRRIAVVSAKSRFYASPAWPDPGDPPFVNAVARLETALAPEALLACLHALEAGFGRRRGAANAPRSLDLDLLDHDGAIRLADGASGHSGGLVLPHPRLGQRDFVLAPLAEIAPDWRHPATGESAARLLAGLATRTAVPVA